MTDLAMTDLLVPRPPWFSLLRISLLFGLAISNGHAQVEPESPPSWQGLQNPSFEESQNGQPTGWAFHARYADQGYRLALDSENPFDGTQSVSIDATDKAADSQFATLNYGRLPVESFRGERVRFRAAVRTADRSADGQAQLWLRVDLETEDGGRASGAFDNMGDRPIRADDWQHYEIVADVDEQASAILIGVIVAGEVKVWIDDASFEIVDAAEPTTAAQQPASVAEAAPPQSFWTPWLLLAVLVMGTLLYSQTANRRSQRIALRFALGYWVLYSFPAVFSSLPPLSVFPSIGAAYQQGVNWIVHTTAETLLGIEGPLVLPNGSGDTTFAYVRLLVICILATVVAIGWSLVWRRGDDQVWVRDLLRTYVRYVLALTLLGYGLAKAGFIATQFGTAQDWQLTRTFGAASPMGLVWTFMAASPAYTFFAGLAEVVGGVLLLFRRTTLLGTLVAGAVMTNVVMLNFCYDVPVKQYSFHLLFMALFIAFPRVTDLLRIFVLNRPSVPVELRPSYAGPVTIWIQRALKAAVVVYLFVIPIARHAHREWSHEHEASDPSGHLLTDRGYRWINEYPFHR